MLWGRSVTANEDTAVAVWGRIANIVEDTLVEQDEFELADDLGNGQ